MADQYSEEQRAAAWAAYYAQQGYTQDQIASMTGGWSQAGGSSSGVAGSGSSSYVAADDTITPSATGKYAMPGYDSNGYKIPTVRPTKAGGKQPQLLDAELLKPLPVIGGLQPADKAPSSGKAKSDNKAQAQQPQQQFGANRRDTVIRTAGGRKWEDPTLLDWDPKWYRLFVGDVSNEVSERTLDEAFNKYKTYIRCKVVRDRLSEKAKYAFIAFKDPEDYLKAWKEMDGKYVGNRPIRLSKIKEEKYGTIETTTLSARKAKEMDKLRRNRGKDSKGRPTLW